MRLLLVLVLVTVTITYGPILVLATTKHEKPAAIVALSYGSLAGLLMIKIIILLLQDEVMRWSVVNLVLIMIIVYHILAILGFGIWLLSDTHFAGIKESESKYGVFVSDFLQSVVVTLNGGGVRIESSSVLGSLWVMLVSFVGLLFFCYLVALIIWALRMPIVRAQYVSAKRVRPKVYNGLK